MKIKLELNKIKETKGTVVYGKEDAGEKDYIPQVYIKKAAFEGGDYPETLKVTLTDE